MSKKPKKFREFYDDEFSHPDTKRYDRKKRNIQKKRKQKRSLKEKFF